MLLAAVAHPATEQTAVAGKRNGAHVSGSVTDARTGTGLAYATLAVKGTTVGIAADASGRFTLNNLPTGRLTLIAATVGYKSAEQELRLEAGETVRADFALEEEALAVEEIVVSASRTETNKKYSPTIVSVASGKLFEATASCNLAETMNFQSGLRVENNCGNCGTTQLRINGLEGQYSQVLLDSRPIFSSLAAMYGLEQLPVSMIERVEVIRGGGSALFGANAIGGVVNIITKEPQRNSLALSNTTNLLEDGAADFNTSLNGSFVSDDYRAGVYLFGMVRDRDSYDRNGDGFSDIPALNTETAGFRAYYKLSPYMRLTAEYHHIHEFRRGGNALNRPPHMADIAEQLDHKIDGGGVKFDYFSPNGRHRAGVYVSAQGIDRDSYFGTGRNPDAYGATSDGTLVAGAQYTYTFEKLLFLPSELPARRIPRAEPRSAADEPQHRGLFPERVAERKTQSARRRPCGQAQHDAEGRLLATHQPALQPHGAARAPAQLRERLPRAAGLQRGPAHRRAGQQGVGHPSRPRPQTRIFAQRERFGRPVPYVRTHPDQPARRRILHHA